MAEKISRHIKCMGNTVLDNLHYNCVRSINLQRTVASQWHIIKKFFFVIYNLTF